MSDRKLEAVRKSLKKQYDNFVDYVIKEMSADKDCLKFIQKFEAITFNDMDIEKELTLTINGSDGSSKTFSFRS